jgi:hypothetical protein
MRLLLIITTTVLLSVGSSCVRLPNDFHYVVDRAADANEALLPQIAELPDKEAQIQLLRTLVEEDNKTLRAIAETVRQGGGGKKE